MKRTILSIVICLFVSTSSLLAQIKVNSAGNVGINNTNPACRLDVAGTVKMAFNGYTVLFTGVSLYPSSGNMDLGISGSSWYRFYANTAFLNNQPVIISDENYKQNIASLLPMMDKVKLLRPVSYNLKTDSKEAGGEKMKSNFQYGFLAQELQQVFPEMVTPREDGVLGIRYTELIPVLVQALKEQQEEIDALNKRITELENAGK